MRALAHHRYARDEYFMLENHSDVKHEYFDGEIFAMAGGSPEHAQLGTRVLIELGVQLRGRPCVPYNSDLRIGVGATGLTTYPDASVICGPLELDPQDNKRQTVLNPTVVVEVLSPSTEDYDRGEKFASFQRIPALRHYVLVSYREPLIEVFSRSPDGAWVRTESRSGGRAELAAIDCTLSVDVIFDGIELR